MKVDIEHLRDYFEYSYKIYQESYNELNEIEDLYHNRHYNETELDVLFQRSQPAETFNVIKLFSNTISGYFNSVINTVKVYSSSIEDKLTAMLLNDIVRYTFEHNNFDMESTQIKIDGLLSGLFCCYIGVKHNGKTDQYGRPIYRIELSHVPSREIVLDPLSTRLDYSDARFIHRYKWVSEDFMREFIKQSGKNPNKTLDKLGYYENFTNQQDVAYHNHIQKMTGQYYDYNSYLLIHTCVKQEDGSVDSIYWSNNEIIQKSKLQYDNVTFPYRVQKLIKSDELEFYGLFREVKESQKAINQALIKLQNMANSSKFIITPKAVDDIQQFANNINSTNGVILVKDINQITEVKQQAKMSEQYTIVEKAYERVQKILGINDSFMGNAYASDSGRKVKLQQNAAIVSLQVTATALKQFYQLLGKDIIYLVKQYYTANEAIRITDKYTGERWIEINKPIQRYTGNTNEFGEPETETVMELLSDPITEEPKVNEEGNYMIAPMPTADTEVAFSDVDVSIEVESYDNEAEENRLMLENLLQGNAGNILAQVDMASYMEVVSLSMESVHTKHSHKVSEIFRHVSEQIRQQQQQQIEQPVEESVNG